MPEFIKVLFADSPLLVGIFALSALLFILWFLNKFIYSNSNEVSTDLSSKAKLAVVKNAYDQDADDENITATGIVQRTVAVDNAANAGLLAARILAIHDIKIESQLLSFQKKQKKLVFYSV